MSFKVTMAAVAAVCALGGASAQAAVIYGNFGPGRSFDHFGAWAVAAPGSFAGSEVSPGMAFTAAIDADVSEINIALSSLYGDDSADVSLWTKDLSIQLGSWHLSGLPGALGPFSAMKISGISGVHLTAGADYVLVAKASNDGFNAWRFNNTGALGDMQINTTGYNPSSTLGAFDILSAAVPEPGSWALMILGFGGAGASLRMARRSRAHA